MARSRSRAGSRTPPSAIASPSAPPATASSSPSTSSGRINCQRDAPSASCSADACRRVTSRASTRFDRLAQAISRMNSTITPSRPRMIQVFRPEIASSRRPDVHFPSLVRQHVIARLYRGETLQIGVRLLDRDARAPAGRRRAGRGGRARRFGVERERRPDVDGAEVADLERRRRDADDRDRRAVEHERAPDRAGDRPGTLRARTDS